MVVVEFPRGQRSITGDAAFDFDDRRGPEVYPGKLFLAGPRHRRGTPGSARESSGFDGGVTRMLPSVRRARIRHNHAHAALRQMENSREFIAVGEWPLRTGPYCEFPVGPLSYGRARLERSMRDVCNGVSRVEPVRSACEPLFHRTFLLTETIIRLPSGVLLEVPEEFFIGNLWNLFPFRLHGIERFLCLALRGRCRSDEITVALDENSRHRLRFVLPEGNQCRAERRRAQHFAVKHSRKPDICRVLMVSRHERSAVNLWNRFAGDGPLRCRRDGIFRGEILRKRLATREFRILQRAARRGIGVVRLPKVPASKGVSAVSAVTMRTLSNGTRSSSAMVCASAVRMFCPISALPVNPVTAPSSPMCSHALISFGSSSL